MLACAEITSIVRRGASTWLLSVEVSGGDKHESVEFLLLDELFLSLDVEVGEIDGDVLCEIDRCSEVTTAFMSACESFAYVPSSIRALYRKIVSKGYSRESSAEAIEIIRRRGFVDENAIALRRAELMVAKLWGRSRILHKLREEGFPDSALQRALVFLEDVDFVQNCARVIEKKFHCLPDDRCEREKIYASLSRLGYSLTDIKGAVKLLSENKQK